MILVLNGNGFLLEGSNPKIEDKQFQGIRAFIYTYIDIISKVSKVG